MHRKTAANGRGADYGLRREMLSPMETLAQSVSTIAPTTTPVATIPLVCALAGNGTWLAYVLATVAILLVALCIGRFARYSSSPGSLYTYASMMLPPWLACGRRPGVCCSPTSPRRRASSAASIITRICCFATPTGHATSAVLLAVHGHRHLDVDRLPRRENFRAPDAVDRSRCRVAMILILVVLVLVQPRLASGLGAIPPAAA